MGPDALLPAESYVLGAGDAVNYNWYHFIRRQDALVARLVRGLREMLAKTASSSLSSATTASSSAREAPSGTHGGGDEELRVPF